MNIQSISVCVPANKCINNCKFCCSKMHTADYDNCFDGDLALFGNYMKDARVRLEFARDNGCNSCMLTGNNEPQQNKNFLRVFGELNASLSKPFRNIEMQTTGATIDESMLKFLREYVGVTTISISVACLDDDATNRELIDTLDKNLNLSKLCREIKACGMNLRLSLNVTDHILVKHDYNEESIFNLCKEYGADQITFRKMWAPDATSEQGKWIAENSKKVDALIASIKEVVTKNGRYLDTLEYGADRYDYLDFSIAIDEDSMAQEVNKNAIKYLILRPNGHLYSKWDSKASLIF